MTQEEPIILHGRHTKLAKRDGHYKGCKRNQAASDLLIQEQTQQQETLVNIISILNIIWNATQVNTHKLNELMGALQKANEDMNILFNITDILTQCFRYHQIYTYAHIILAYLRACLTYMRQDTTHTMYCVDAAMTNILSPDMPPVEELGTMLR